MAMKKLPPGRGSAIETAFRVRKTKPKEYTIIETLLRASNSRDKSGWAKCELCGMPNRYQFPLRHASDFNLKSKKSLWVGQDCIKSFMLYTGYESNLIDEMMKTMTAKVNEKKKELFQKDYPNFERVLISSHTKVDELILRFEASRSLFRTPARRIPEYQKLLAYTSKYKRDGFLADTEAKRVKGFLRELTAGRIEKKLKAHGRFIEKNKTIADDMKANKRFYDTFWKASAALKWENNPTLSSRALSPLEKEIYTIAYKRHTKPKRKKSEKKDSEV